MAWRRLEAWAAALAICAAHGAGAAEPAAKVVIYQGATLIDGTGAPPRPEQAIVVEGERIAAVGSLTAMSLPAEAETVDARGLFVLPGLIDTHVHMATPPNPPRAEALMRRQLYSGVTAVRDMADDTRSVAELQRRARVGEIPAPDVYFAALMAGPSFFTDPRTLAVSRGDTPGKVPWMQAIDETTDLPLAVAMARGTYATAIKIYANLPGELVKRITAEAHRQGMRVWAHSAVFPASPRDVIDAGVDVSSHVCPIAYQVSEKMPASYQDPTPVDEARLGRGDHPQMAALFDAMKAKGVVLDATVRVYAEGEKRWKANPKGRPPRCSADTAYRLTSHAFRRGVEISTGTDGDTDWREAYPSLHEELELLAGKAGMPPLQVIRSATLVAAKTLGREAEMGTVAPRKLANLVFVTKDPSKDVGALRTVAFTVKRGQVFRRVDYRPISEAEGIEHE
ncbi:amidohydrolase family protein [Phenylobacterium sp.]|jgi:imidazolonepropionase-like amidohydrolase|uniref:amidohydrolase family protein n=1 Tax=Phenylobacterium sp. TaxID=1871053 RepID=UPI002F95A249